MVCVRKLTLWVNKCREADKYSDNFQQYDRTKKVCPLIVEGIIELYSYALYQKRTIYCAFVAYHRLFQRYKVLWLDLHKRIPLQSPKMIFEIFCRMVISCYTLCQVFGFKHLSVIFFLIINIR